LIARGEGARGLLAAGSLSAHASPTKMTSAAARPEGKSARNAAEFPR
jgi:hypothetical protein